MPMYTEASVNYKQRLPTQGRDRLPTPVVQRNLVAQPVNLRPMGNTVTITTKAENPFAMAGEMTVLTQASGGMAKPDPAMQSQRLQSKFLPIGQELAGALEDQAYSAFNQYDADAASMNRAQYDKDSGKRGYWENYVKSQQPTSSAGATAGSIFSTVVTGAKDVFTTINKTKVAGSNAAIAAANKAIAQAGKYVPGPPPKKSYTIPLVIGGVAVVGIALFFFLRKK